LSSWKVNSAFNEKWWKGIKHFREDLVRSFLAYGHACNAGREVLIWSGKLVPGGDSNARPSASESDSRAFCFQQLRKSYQKRLLHTLHIVLEVLSL